MLNFGRLLSFPLTYKNLNEKLKTISTNQINAFENKDGIIVSAKVNDHNVSIQIYDKKIQISSPVSIFCDCDFFKFNLAYALHKNNSLLIPDGFVLKPPKVKNPYLSLSGCKHIILVSQILWKNHSFILKNQINTKGIK